MKHFVSSLSLFILTVTLTWHTGPAHAQSAAGTLGDCPIPRLSGHDEGNPQSEFFRGRCLAPIHYVLGKVTEGRAPSASAQAHHMDRDQGPFPLEFTPLGDDVTPVGTVPLYKVTYRGRNVCPGEKYDPLNVLQGQAAPPDGSAILVPGYWHEGFWRSSVKDAQNVERPAFTVSCISGAVAKCIHWGYVPWRKYKGEPLDKYHQACVRAARAMYHPTSGTSYTCQGTKIDIYDRLGIKKKDKDDTLVFESLWKEDGPVCLTRTRWKHCNEELPDQLSLASRPPCKDPVAQPNGSWATRASSGALIAIGSRADNDAQVCPNHRDSVRCPNTSN